MIQVSILISSFLILFYYEQERILLGNSINTAGKNRLLTITSSNEIKDSLMTNTIQEKNQSISNLKNNIHFLKVGGNKGEFQLKPMPAIFEDDIIELEKAFSDYKNTSIDFLRTEISSDEYRVHLSEFEISTQKLLLISDNITNNLSEYDQQFSKLMIFLEMMLLSINVLLHLFLIFMLISIFRKESDRLVKNEKFVSIGELSARIAHDLRNPLSLIKMAISIIQKNEDLNPQSIEKIRVIEKSISRMSHQIDDVMAYVRTSDLQKTKNNINEIMEESLLRANLPKTICVEYMSTMTRILCDKERIIIVLVNLFANANDAMEGKGKLTIKTQSHPNTFEIIVENSGASIPPENLESIFSPLFTTRNHGTGLGLATCKNILTEHKGTISASNNPTRFIINIPKI